MEALNVDGPIGGLRCTVHEIRDRIETLVIKVAVLEHDGRDRRER